ncbi:MAG: homoserine kinase [Actinomycetota bacterium]
MRVRAPGSSANLGPGFDVLGLAVTRHVWATDEGDGPPCGPDHIARIAYEQAGGTGSIWFDFELEPSRGLGFSAAARAAGAYLAYRQAGLVQVAAQEAAYRVVADIEGHGDNAAPAVFGGIHVIAGDRWHRLPVTIPARLLFWVPDLETLTDDSRACLPAQVDRSDAVFNLGRIGLLVAALYEQRLDLLGEATQDRLHQPPRLAACEPSARAYATMLDNGASAAWLSGSGPTVAAVVTPDRVDAVSRALCPSGVVLDLPLDEVGVVDDEGGQPAG